MHVTETLSDGLKRAFTVIVPASTIETRRDTKLSEIGQKIRLPGFRPGKVPATLVRQRYGSSVMAEVLEESVKEAADQVIQERNLRPAIQPRLIPTGDMKDPTKAADFEFRLELEILPEITIPDLSSIHLTRLKGEAPADAIDKSLEGIRARQRTMEDIEEARPASAGEFLTLDFKGSIDGTPFPGGEATNMDVEVGGPGFIPGFTDQLEGLSPGENRTLTVTFPAEYHDKEVAGKDASFEVTAKALRRAILPPIDDALAEKLGFENLAEMRDIVARQQQREYDQLSRLRLKRELLDALAGLTSFDSPPTMVEAEFAQIWQRVEADRKEGKLDEEDANKDEDTLRHEYRAIAERRVRLGLLLAEIGRANTITVTQDELNRALRQEVGRYPGQEQQVIEFFRKNQNAVEALRGPIFEEKVVDYLLELAKVDERPATLEELQEDVPLEL